MIHNISKEKSSLNSMSSIDQKERAENRRKSLIVDAIDSANGSIGSLAQYLTSSATEGLNENSIIDCVLSYCNRKMQNKENKDTEKLSQRDSRIEHSPLKEIPQREIPVASKTVIKPKTLDPVNLRESSKISQTRNSIKSRPSASFSSVTSEDSNRSSGSNNPSPNRTFTFEEKELSRGSTPCEVVPSQTFDESEMYQEGFHKFQNSLNRRSKSGASAAPDLGSIMSTPLKNSPHPNFVPSIIQPSVNYPKFFPPSNNNMKTSTYSIPLIIQVQCPCANHQGNGSNNGSAHSVPTSTLIYGNSGPQNQSVVNIVNQDANAKQQISSETFVCRHSPIPEEVHNSSRTVTKAEANKSSSVRPNNSLSGDSERPGPSRSANKHIPLLLADKHNLDWGNVPINSYAENSVCITNAENVSMLMRLRIRETDSTCFEVCIFLVNYLKKTEFFTIFHCFFLDDFQRFTGSAYKT